MSFGMGYHGNAECGLFRLPGCTRYSSLAFVWWFGVLDRIPPTAFLQSDSNIFSSLVVADFATRIWHLSERQKTLRHFRLRELQCRAKLIAIFLRHVGVRFSCFQDLVWYLRVLFSGFWEFPLFFNAQKDIFESLQKLRVIVCISSGSWLSRTDILFCLEVSVFQDIATFTFHRHFHEFF